MQQTGKINNKTDGSESVVTPRLHFGLIAGRSHFDDESQKHRYSVRRCDNRRALLLFLLLLLRRRRRIFSDELNTRRKARRSH